MTPGGVTCARLRLAHVTPPGVTSQNPHTLYTIKVVVGQVGQLGEQLSVLRASYRQLAGLPEAPTKVF